MNKKPLIGIIICILLINTIPIVLGNADNIQQRKGTKIESNLAPNSSFEEGDTLPIGWTYYPETNCTYTWNSDFAHFRLKSVGISNLTNNSPPNVFWTTTDFIPVNCTIDSLQFSAWFKFVKTPPDMQYAHILCWEYDINYQPNGGFGSTSPFNDTEWHQIQAHTGYDNITKFVKLSIGQGYGYGAEPDSMVEIRFDDIYFGHGNEPPNKPTITGETNGGVRISYNYTIQATDPNQDFLRYFIDWGDTSTLDYGFFESGEEVTVSHQWWEKGVYTIRVKAIDENYAESDRVNLSVTMPYSYTIPIIQFWMKLLERFPNAFPILRYFLGFN